MALSIQFQNLNRANSEILKAFNSQNAAKALEAYQPLNAKERSRSKLKALQLLKQESSSVTLADINLNESALAASLQKADGATLQAMLNLLSAHMIEQNKNNILQFIDKEEERRKQKEKKQDKDQEQGKKQKQEKPKKKQKETKTHEDLIKAVEEYLQKAKARLIDLYDGILDAMSIENIKKFFEDSIHNFKKYLYEMPVEFLDKNVITPIYDFPEELKKQIDVAIDKLTKRNQKRTFTAKEIRSILRSSIDTVRDEFNDIIEKSIQDLDDKISIEKSESKDWKPTVIVNQKMNVKELKTKIHQR